MRPSPAKHALAAARSEQPTSGPTRNDYTDVAQCARQRPPRHTARLLLDPLFGPFFFGKLLSTAGIWVFNIVAAIVVWDMTRSSFAVGLVSVMLFAPQLALAPAAGARADRGNLKGQLIVGRLLVALATGTLSLNVWAAGIEGMPGAWPVLVASGITGIGFVIGGPAQLSILPALVRRNELASAVALNSLPPTLARAGGAAVGTVILVAVGPGAAFAVTSATNLFFVLVILALPLNNRVERAEGSDGTVRAGLRFLRSTPPVAFLIVGSLAIGIGADPIITLTPALSESLGRDQTLVGALATSFGIGAGVSYFAVRRVRHRLGLPALSNLGLGLLAAGMVVAGTAPGAPLALSGFAVSGIGFCWGIAGTTTRLYEMVPETLRGRMMALYAMAFVGSRPTAAAVTGAITDATSVTVSFLLVAGVVGALTAACHVGTSRLTGDVRPGRGQVYGRDRD